MSTATNSQVKAKIYHLVNKGNSTSAEIYTRIDRTRRVRSEDQPMYRPLMQVTYTDEKGESKTMRFKMNCPTFDQHEQIEKYKILANERFTDAERNALKFYNGALYTKNKNVQNFLDNHPENVNFKGECPDIKGPKFLEYDPVAVKRNDLANFNRRHDAYTKIRNMDLEEAQGMLIKLFGVGTKVPGELGDCILTLVDFLDAEDNDLVLDAILASGRTLEEDVTILIGILNQKGIISFDEVPNFVVKNKLGKIMPLKEISSSLPKEERTRFLIQFLCSPDGSLTLNDLRNELKSVEVDKPVGEVVTEKKAESKKADVKGKVTEPA